MTSQDHSGRSWMWVWWELPLEPVSSALWKELLMVVWTSRTAASDSRATIARQRNSMLMCTETTSWDNMLLSIWDTLRWALDTDLQVCMVRDGEKLLVMYGDFSFNFWCVKTVIEIWHSSLCDKIWFFRRKMERLSKSSLVVTSRMAWLLMVSRPCTPRYTLLFDLTQRGSQLRRRRWRPSGECSVGVELAGWSV